MTWRGSGSWVEVVGLGGCSVFGGSDVPAVPSSERHRVGPGLHPSEVRVDEPSYPPWSAGKPMFSWWRKKMKGRSSERPMHSSEP
ncbi:hypothetical protein E2C01_075119 [Portunus trituberculatus]|uniref:Uncharacterized protein n=1 Tax=Portunus trituberculatus TaxID=210409 RepID=A0A5B7IFC1_PORTR|nr:hypothetical protein [Portunus trituberculatus]